MWFKSQLQQTPLNKFLFPQEKQTHRTKPYTTVNTVSPQYCLGRSRASNPVILKVPSIVGKGGLPGETEPCVGWASSVPRGLLGCVTPNRASGLHSDVILGRTEVRE